MTKYIENKFPDIILQRIGSAKNHLESGTQKFIKYGKKWKVKSSNTQSVPTYAIEIAKELIKTDPCVKSLNLGGKVIISLNGRYSFLE